MTSGAFSKRHPATGEILQVYPCADAVDVGRATQAARQVMRREGPVPLDVRAKVLNDVARRVLKQTEALTDSLAADVGKPVSQALEGDLLPAVSWLRFAAHHGPRQLKPRLLPFHKGILMGRVHWERRVPHGVVGIISPWNFPFAIPISGVATAWMGGNAVILKPSELAPASGEQVVELFQAALSAHGLSPDWVQLLQGDGSTGAALVEGDIDYMVFTGSVKTGQRIRSALLPRGIGVSLELGGSDPMIVLSGADVEAVTSYALWGRLTNSGQACAAVKRLFVPREMLDPVTHRLVKKMQQLRMGPPEDTLAHLGPVIDAGQRQVLDEQVQDALARGATALAGGSFDPGQPGYYYPPTVLVNVPAGARVLTEEVFGPVLPVVGYEAVEEALEMANALPLGLGASVFGPFKEAKRVADRLEAGMVTINDLPTLGYALPQVPWSGWKESGPGVSHGREGLLELTRGQVQCRNYLYELEGLRKPFWHFGEQPDPGFSRVLLRCFASEGLWDKCQPGLLWAMWQNRSKKKL